MIMKTPSTLQIGDDAILNFFEAGEINHCKIKAVHFTIDKVAYDVEIPVTKEVEGEIGVTIIKDVDSTFISPMFEKESFGLAGISKILACKYLIENCKGNTIAQDLYVDLKSIIYDEREYFDPKELDEILDTM